MITKVANVCIPFAFLLVLGTFQLGFQSPAVEIGWLMRTWACQAQYNTELQNAQQSNPKAMVMAPKNTNDGNCSSLQCILKTGPKMQQTLPDRTPPFAVPDFIPCNTMANMINKQSNKNNPGQLCYTNNGQSQCMTIQQIADALNQPDGNRGWTHKSEPIDIAVWEDSED